MTITELIAESGAQCRIYDIGRQISKVARGDFEQYELGQRSYPTPYLQHAWLAILTWQPKDPEKHNIWFLKLPLDEQNQIQAADRDAFIRHWLTVVKNPDQDYGDAPCSFRPDEHRMAYFHGLAVQLLQQPTTQFYHTARAYLAGDIDLAQWQNLALQGIADTVVRIQHDGNDALLASALPILPVAPRNTWLSFLGYQALSLPLSQAVAETVEMALTTDIEASDLGLFARALQGHASKEQGLAVLDKLMAHPKAQDAEFVSTLFSRCWQILEGERLDLALELAAVIGEDVFTALVADTMTLPGMRQKILTAFRNPQRSPQLSEAIGRMMTMLRQAMHS